MSTVFEKLLSGEWPCAKVYEDDRVFAFMDAGQVNDGHVIVATKQPFETLLDMDEDTAAALMGRELIAKHRADPFYWFCRCWCLCAIRFGCCLARARNLRDVFRCLRWYRACLRRCQRPLHCA